MCVCVTAGFYRSSLFVSWSSTTIWRCVQVWRSTKSWSCERFKTRTYVFRLYAQRETVKGEILLQIKNFRDEAFTNCMYSIIGGEGCGWNFMDKPQNLRNFSPWKVPVIYTCTCMYLVYYLLLFKNVSQGILLFSVACSPHSLSACTCIRENCIGSLVLNHLWKTIQYMVIALIPCWIFWFCQKLNEEPWLLGMHNDLILLSNMWRMPYCLSIEMPLINFLKHVARTLHL